MIAIKETKRPVAPEIIRAHTATGTPAVNLVNSEPEPQIKCAPSFEKNRATAFGGEQMLKCDPLDRFKNKRLFRLELGIIQAAHRRQTTGRQRFPGAGQNRDSHPGIKSVGEMSQRPRADRDLDQADVGCAEGNPEVVDPIRINSRFGRIANDFAGATNKVIRPQSEIAMLIDVALRSCQSSEPWRGKGKKASG